MNAEDVARLDFLVPDHEGSMGRFRNISISGDSWVLTRAACQPTDALPCHSLLNADFYTLIIYLQDSEQHDVWCDEMHLPGVSKFAGSIAIFDRRYDWHSVIRGPLDCAVLHVSKFALNQLAGVAIDRSIDLLDSPGRVDGVDEAVQHLALAIMPSLEQPRRTSELFTEQIIRMIFGHLVHTLWQPGARVAEGRNRLAAWQMRRAREVVDVNIRNRIGVQDLAAACRLSPSHFSYLFKRTNGISPHQWLIERRLEHAKNLLRTTNRTLVDVAFAAGFADQSHFTRVFSRHVMASPLAWRREHQLCNEPLLDARAS